MQIALASRSVAPFPGGGGIGEYVDATARILAQLGDVTIFTTDVHRSAFETLQATNPRRLAPVRYEFVPEPDDAHGYYTELHKYTSDLLDAIADRYPGGGPDLIELSDYLGEAFVLAQAKTTLDPRFARSRLAVRLHTTAEVCAVLDGHLDATDFSTRITAAMERYSLQHADVLLWPGGDVLGLYERFYGAGKLAPARQIRNPLLLDAPLPQDVVPDVPEAPFRLLYLGRLERRKGVHNLVNAVTTLHNGDWELTLLGGDTQTSPLGASMRLQLESMVAGDPRIVFADEVPRAALGEFIARHDAVVLPSLWECWPYVALEAMRQNRPVLATPTGGFAELIRHGENGWLTADTSEAALAAALEDLLSHRAAVFDMRRRRAPQRTIEALANADEVRENYRALLAETPPRRVRRHSTPLVSVIVPYYRMAAFVEDTIRSVVAQTYPRIEIIVVNDGSLDADDLVLAELAARYPLSVLAQPNAGLGSARNFGISQSRGRYVLPLDSDNMIAPTFVERCVDVLETDRRAAFVTTWSQYVDEQGDPLGGAEVGYQPLGNQSDLLERNNVAGDAAAVIRRRIFDLGFRYSQELTSYEDWHLYLELHRAGRLGHVIPERLLLYRVRDDSMIREVGLDNTERLYGEIQAHVRENEVRWAARNA